MILEATLLWTILAPFGETVLQYPTQQACRAAINEGLPYIGVPPKDQLSCAERPDRNPIAVCDVDVAFPSRGETCKSCIDRNGKTLTAVLCEGSGLRPASDADSDDCEDNVSNTATPVIHRSGACNRWWTDNHHH